MVNDENGDALPTGWIITTLGEVANLIGGGTPSRAIPEYFTGEIIWLTPTEIPKNRIAIISESREKITEKALMNSSARMIPAGSVLLTARASIGYVAIAGVDLTTNQGFAAFIPENGILNSYLAYWLWSQADHFKNIATGTTFKEISKAVLRNEAFPLPPLAEQQRIVEAIEAQFTRLDAGVAALKRLRASLRRYKAAVLKAAAEGKLVEQDPNDEPGSELLQRILKERRAKWEAEQRAKGKDPRKLKYEEPAAPNTADLPDLPEGWVWARAEQICDFITKGTTPHADKMFPSKGEIPYIKVYNLTHEGHLDFSVKPTFIAKETHEIELGRSRVYPGDVLMNIVGPPLGKVSIVPETYPEWNVNQAIAIFRPLSGYENKFLALCLLNDEILSWAVMRAKATAGQFNLTLEICRDIPLPVPPSVTQTKIVEEVEGILSIVDNLELKIRLSLKRAERLRQSILREAFAGRLVPQDPDDEPASALLKRIRRARQADSKQKERNGKKTR